MVVFKNKIHLSRSKDDWERCRSLLFITGAPFSGVEPPGATSLRDTLDRYIDDVEVKHARKGSFNWHPTKTKYDELALLMAEEMQKAEQEKKLNRAKALEKKKEHTRIENFILGVPVGVQDTVSSDDEVASVSEEVPQISEVSFVAIIY